MTMTPPRGGRPKNAITKTTRQSIADLLTTEFHWSGGLTEVDFLNELYLLDEMPSTDYRREIATAAQDIAQHRVRNHDWPERWIFSDDRFKLYSCPDEEFIAFVELTVSRIVRSAADAEKLAKKLSELLAPDGYEVTQQSDGRYVCHERGFHAPMPAPLTMVPLKLDDRSSLDPHLKNIEADLARGSYPGVVSACKDLLETVLKQILNERKIAPIPKTIPDLFAAVRKELDLDVILIPDDAKGSQAEARGMEAQARMIAEIRNSAGRGHGRTVDVPLRYRNAQHVLYTTVAVVTNLFAVWDEV
ncbi:hypothetical protein [Nocardia salmonicida]|uniref:AbiJ-related protein n=1 Tax=Nocardia salmonicida TaxID=53431 RepID=UPI0007A55710|nr:hypothetical protein [Nocardia salmonicida]